MWTATHTDDYLAQLCTAFATPCHPFPPVHRNCDDLFHADQAMHDDSGEDEGDCVEVSAQYQAVIPAWRPLPAQPTQREAKFLQATRVYPPPQDSQSPEETPGMGPDAASKLASATEAFKEAYTGLTAKQRAAFLGDTVAELDRQLGPDLVRVSDCKSSNLAAAMSLSERHTCHRSDPACSHLTPKTNAVTTAPASAAAQTLAHSTPPHARFIVFNCCRACRL